MPFLQSEVQERGCFTSGVWRLFLLHLLIDTGCALAAAAEAADLVAVVAAALLDLRQQQIAALH